MSATSGTPNRLARETSPYLRQHAHNPVDWYPWGPEALGRARELGRPIFLSVGYSACHWCHVMERESFEDAEVARLLNEHFVSIKVDREERPDVDQIYMTAVQMLTGQGGWPMSVFLTPELKPFYAGTYFPPTDHYGRPGFKRVLRAVADAWENRRAEVTRSAAQLTEQLRRTDPPPPGGSELGPATVRRAGSALAHVFDPTNGGFGSAPKFPHPMDLRVLLRVCKRFGDEDALAMAKLTLDRMAGGGIYDHLGGGFHRYSTDEHWLVPHFEKMLYDNALLATAYTEGFQATRDVAYARVVEETLEYVRREMTAPEGYFYSTQDADSEGDEGRFYVWSEAEIREALGADTADLFSEAYDVTTGGNWEGKNILHRVRTVPVLARMRSMPEAELEEKLLQAREKLYAVRARRVAPGRDEKLLVSWNGLMIDALARAARVFGQPRYAEAAAKAATFLLERVRTADGRVLRTLPSESSTVLYGYLEDYAFLIEALVSLYEVTFEIRWLLAARELAEVMNEEFWDAQAGGFFYTGKRHEALITRPKDYQDSSTPSGNAMAATALLRLAAFTERQDFFEKAEATLRSAAGILEKAPHAAGQMVVALDFYLGPREEVAILGDRLGREAQEVLRGAWGGFEPRRLVALSRADDKDAAALVPLLADKRSLGPVTTYVCRDFTCGPPLVGVKAAKEALE